LVVPYTSSLLDVLVSSFFYVRREVALAVCTLLVEVTCSPSPCQWLSCGFRRRSCPECRPLLCFWPELIRASLRLRDLGASLAGMFFQRLKQFCVLGLRSLNFGFQCVNGLGSRLGWARASDQRNLKLRSKARPEDMR